MFENLTVEQAQDYLNKLKSVGPALYKEGFEFVLPDNGKDMKLKPEDIKNWTVRLTGMLEGK